jgi:hypothetical protein
VTTSDDHGRLENYPHDHLGDYPMTIPTTIPTTISATIPTRTVSTTSLRRRKVFHECHVYLDLAPPIPRKNRKRHSTTD